MGSSRVVSASGLRPKFRTIQGLALGQRLSHREGETAAHVSAVSPLELGDVSMVERRSADPEFSRLVDVSEVKRSPWRARLSADEATRAAIAARFGILAVERFEADISLRRTPIGMIHLQGSIEAEVVQECVVTLESVPATIRETFEVYYSEAVVDDQPSGDLTMDDELWPDPIVNGKIDVGEAATEHLGLALDPYPRREGASFDATAPNAESPPTQRPFADLAALTAKPRGFDPNR